MNRFDDEDKIISQFQEVNDNEVMFATQSETIEAVYSSIHTEALWKNWINSSGKSDPPPDYYLPKDELMMDVMRVDDHAFVDKKGKIQNPTKVFQSENYTETAVTKKIHNPLTDCGFPFATFYLCTLQRYFYLVKFVTELLIRLGKIGNGLACVQHSRMIAATNILAYLGS